jgi:hypothetical protein
VMPAAALVVLAAAAEELARGLWSARSVLPSLVSRAVGAGRSDPAHRDEASVIDARRVQEPAQRAS